MIDPLSDPTDPIAPCAIRPFARSRTLEQWPDAPQRPAGALATANRGWRTRWPQVTLTDCSRCGLCIVYCPDGAIGLDPARYPLVAEDWCKGCGLCAAACPKRLIAMCDESAREAAR
jgi:pyruvate ferredoxin oxidoreductase delta subunit